MLKNLYSDRMGDSSKIGLECKTGEFDDCGTPQSHHVPAGCEGVLIFENDDDSSTCGLYCDPAIQPRINECASTKKCGWTKYIR